jgi:hypothetical protein
MAGKALNSHTPVFCCAISSITPSAAATVPCLTILLSCPAQEALQQMASTSNGTEGSEGGIAFYEDVENLKKLCDFLRSKHGPPVREALLMEKRVHYIKGRILNMLIPWH